MWEWTGLSSGSCINHKIIGSSYRLFIKRWFHRSHQRVFFKCEPDLQVRQIFVHHSQSSLTTHLLSLWLFFNLHMKPSWSESHWQTIHPVPVTAFAGITLMTTVFKTCKLSPSSPLFFRGCGASPTLPYKQIKAVKELWQIFLGFNIFALGWPQWNAIARLHISSYSAKAKW